MTYPSNEMRLSAVIEKHAQCFFGFFLLLAVNSLATPQLDWSSPPVTPHLGEFDASHVGLEYQFVYELCNRTPGYADADTLIALWLNAPNGKALHYFRINIVQGNLWPEPWRSTPSAAGFSGSVPAADNDPDNYITIFAYAPADMAISSNATICAESMANGPFNTLTGAWVALKPHPQIAGTLLSLR